MSTSDSQAVSITLLGKEFNVNCPPDAEAELLASADFLNERMQEVKRGGRVLGLERIAVMTALNLAHELLNSKQGFDTDIEEKLRHLCQKIDFALDKSQS